MKNSISVISARNICVVSFSTNGDLLSQWRAYGSSKGGYSLEFHTARLREQAENDGFILAQCVYDEQTQRELITDLVAETVEAESNPLMEAGSPLFPGLNTGASFSYHIGMLAAILKNRSFEEECEWRLVSRARMVQTMAFRVGQSMLIPYFEFQLGVEKGKYLASVTVGPVPHMELAGGAVTMLLRHWGILKPLSQPYGSQTIDVHLSKVPFRNW